MSFHKGFALLWFFWGMIASVIISTPNEAAFSDHWLSSESTIEMGFSETELLNTREILSSNSNGLQSQILTLDDLSLTHLQNVVLSYDLKQQHIYAYYPTVGYLERYSGFDSRLKYERLDTLILRGEQLNIHLQVLSEEGKIIMWEAAIGQVFEYDLKTKVLQRIDDSRVRDFMFGSGSVYVDSLGIYAFGGYGLWEHKNILLRYDFSFREWTKSPEAGQIPEKSSRNWMWSAPEQQSLFFLNDGKVSGSVRTNGYFNYGVYRFNLLENNWVRVNQFLLPRDRDVAWGAFRHNKAYSLDSSVEWAHVGGRLFMRLDNGAFYQLKKEVFPNTMSITGFYDKGRGEWLFVGRNTIMDARNLWFAYSVLNDEMFEKVDTTSWLWYILTEEWLYVLFGILLLAVLWILFQKLRFNTTFKSEPDHIQITVENEQLIVSKNGRHVLLTDEYIQQIWQIIVEQKKKEDREMMMVDFDDTLFTVSNSTSYRSKMKAKLFDEINSGLKGYVIRAKRSNLDKRYKVIEINLDIIELA